MSSTGTTVNPYRFGAAWGYTTDTASSTQGSGLLQLGARYYWPEIGRFIQQDPIGDGMNWYAYAGNNPVVWVDPTGLLTAQEAYDWYMGGVGGASDVLDQVLLNGATQNFGETAGRREFGCASDWDLLRAGANWGGRVGLTAWSGGQTLAAINRATAMGGLVTHRGPEGMAGLRPGDWVRSARHRAAAWLETIGLTANRVPPGWDGLSMQTTVVAGDLLDQDVDVIVNPWNRNIIPWWLLLPQGVSGAIKRRGGYAPFRELGRMGPIPLGGAVITSAGKLPFKAIIHVAGINMLWRASEQSVRDAVRNAVALAEEKGFRSIAFPLIGAGSGGMAPERARAIMEAQLRALHSPLEARIVTYRKPR